jgi:hypothetical protein
MADAAAATVVDPMAATIDLCQLGLLLSPLSSSWIYFLGFQWALLLFFSNLGGYKRGQLVEEGQPGSGDSRRTI